MPFYTPILIGLQHTRTHWILKVFEDVPLLEFLSSMLEEMASLDVALQVWICGMGIPPDGSSYRSILVTPM
jgi:hypothetical protein